MTFLADDKEAARDPLASTYGNLVTPGQLAAIRQAARAAGLDPDEECMEQMDCLTDELSRRAAAAFIEHLERAAASISPIREVK